jgi:hypothetical protein
MFSRTVCKALTPVRSASNFLANRFDNRTAAHSPSGPRPARFFPRPAVLSPRRHRAPRPRLARGHARDHRLRLAALTSRPLPPHPPGALLPRFHLLPRHPPFPRSPVPPLRDSTVPFGRGGGPRRPRPPHPPADGPTRSAPHPQAAPRTLACTTPLPPSPDRTPEQNRPRRIPPAHDHSARPLLASVSESSGSCGTPCCSTPPTHSPNSVRHIAHHEGSSVVSRHLRSWLAGAVALLTALTLVHGPAAAADGPPIRTRSSR